MKGVSWRAWATWALAVAFLIFQFNMQTVYAIINPSVQRDLDLSLASVAFAASAYNWTYAIAQFSSGSLLDRFGPRWSLTPRVGLAIVAIYLYATATGSTSLWASQVVLAVSASVSFVAAGYVGQEWFGKRHYGLMFGFVQSLTGFSSAIGQGVMLKVSESIGWRSLLLVMAGIAAGLFVLFLLLFRDPASRGQVGRPRTSLLRDLQQIFARYPIVWLVGAWGGLAFGMQLALGVIWAPKILAMRIGDGAYASYASISIWAGLGLGAMIWNPVSDFLRRRKPVFVAGYLVMLAVLAAVLFMDLSPTAIVALFFIFGVANEVHMLGFTVLGDVVPAELIGTASAMSNGVFFVIGGVLASSRPWSRRTIRRGSPQTPSCRSSRRWRWGSSCVGQSGNPPRTGWRESNGVRRGQAIR